MKKQTQVAVIGAGLAGLTTAVALAKSGINVTLVAPHRPLPEAQEGVADPRVYAISSENQAFFVELGIWSAIPERRIAPVESMLIMGHAPSTHSSTHNAPTPTFSGVLDLHAWQANQATLTWILESREIERALRQASQLLSIQWIDASLSDWQRVDEKHLSLSLSNGASLITELVVGADGGRSNVRELSGITMTRYPYDHIGLVCHLDIEHPHQYCARQWFTPDGILALLPMPMTPQGYQASMVWSMHTAQAQELLALSDKEQQERLNERLYQATSGVLGRLNRRSPLHGFPLAVQKTSSMVRPNVALVGDAAHIVHPLAGQGLNLGIGDIICLAQVLASKQPYQSVGDIALLRKFERQRAEPVMQMRMMTDMLYHLFYRPNQLLTDIRNTGMSIVNRLGVIKKALITKAR